MIVLDGPQVKDLQTHHFLHLGPDQLLGHVGSGSVLGWAALAASWDRLPPDRHMADRGSYRYRRYGQFRLSLQASSWSPLPSRPSSNPCR
jgi:hypothetical protein